MKEKIIDFSKDIFIRPGAADHRAGADRDELDPGKGVKGV